MQKRKIKCDHEGCGKQYCSYFNLKRHIESSHLGLRRFKCPTCFRYLSSKQNFIDHQNIHTGDKPYLCDFPNCQMRFRQLSQFYLHSKLHSDVSAISASPSVSENAILLVLSTKLSNQTEFYTIPNLPYNSLSEIYLPSITKPQEFHIPQLNFQIYSEKTIE